MSVNFHLYIYFACLSVCLYSINVKTAERLKLYKICLHQNFIFENFENPQILFFIKSAKFFVFVLQCIQEKIFTNEIKDGRNAP